MVNHDLRSDQNVLRLDCPEQHCYGKIQEIAFVDKYGKERSKQHKTMKTTKEKNKGPEAKQAGHLNSNNVNNFKIRNKQTV